MLPVLSIFRKRYKCTCILIYVSFASHHAKKCSGHIQAVTTHVRLCILAVSDKKPRYPKYRRIGYSETRLRKPPLRLTFAVDVERWLPYKGTCHVILPAKLHDMYLYKTDAFFTSTTILSQFQRWLAFLHMFHCLIMNKRMI